MKSPRFRIFRKIKRALCLVAGLGLGLGGSSDALAQAASVQAETPPKAPPSDNDAADHLESTDFVRYVESEEGGDGIDRLETVVRSYRRGAEQVDLVSVVHIADTDYYTAMNEQLGTYEVVLYEMVGGPVEERDLEAAESEPSMAGIRFAQNLMKRLLALDYQIDGIDYSADHFVHADVDWIEYSELMTSRNQSMATLFQRAMEISLSGEEVPGVPTSDAESMAMLGGLLRAITAGDANGLKRIVAPMLGEAEALISMIEGDDGTVIVTERNKVVMKGVHEQLAAGKKSIGVFYGAAHMPDLEQRLMEEGFKAAEVDWMTAWEIGASPAPKAKAAAEPGATPEEQEKGASEPAPAVPAAAESASASTSGDDAVVNALGFVGELLQDEELMRSAIGMARQLAGSEGQ